MRKNLGLLVLVASLVFATGSAFADTIYMASGTSVAGDPIAAKVLFSISGNVLTVTLTNTNTGAVSSYVPADVLTALFFDIQGNPALTYQAATASNVRTGTTFTAGPVNVTSQWAYAFNASGLGGTGSPIVTQDNGLGTAGFGIFSGLGGGQQFNYGIVDNGFTGTNGNPAVNGGTFAQNSITFALQFNGTLQDSDISNIRFQYGTALDEGTLTPPGPRPPTVPEPASMTVLATGLAAIALRRKFKK